MIKGQASNGREMRVLITGAKGQLGWELLRTVPRGVEIEAVDVAELDITDRVAVLQYTERWRPGLIVNAAAYTAVDRAESEPGLAIAVNSDGAAHLAEAAHRTDSRLIQISTDFVFDGTQAFPYRPCDPPNPVSQYGRSKLDGELRVGQLLPNRSLIIRTSWLYSSHGANFVKTMLRLMRERETVSVVADQVGTPTWAHGLAEAVWSLAGARASGTLHWSDAGVASWYDFAQAIAEEALERKLLTNLPGIQPIATAQYPTPARRPGYSVLDKTATWSIIGHHGRHWRTALRLMLDELKSTA